MGDRPPPIRPKPASPLRQDAAIAIELQTERLLLRRYRETDLDRLFEIHSREDVARYLFWEPRSREETEAALAKRIAGTRLEQDDDVVTLAVERREDGLLLGDVQIFLRSAKDRQVELGYIFHPDAGGKGYATEATRAVIDFIFKEVGAHRVFARAHHKNPPSHALALRLGMRQEGHVREMAMFKGEWADEIIFGVLEQEWPAAADPA